MLQFSLISYSYIDDFNVNGDTIIDIFDLFAMLSHMNAEEKLSGVYFDVGCVLENDEIDLSVTPKQAVDFGSCDRDCRWDNLLQGATPPIPSDYLPHGKLKNFSNIIIRRIQ